MIDIEKMMHDGGGVVSVCREPGCVDNHGAEPHIPEAAGLPVTEKRKKSSGAPARRRAWASSMPDGAGQTPAMPVYEETAQISQAKRLALRCGAVAALGAYVISRYGKRFAREGTQKTDSDRAQDVAYTINHALACTATDFIDPYVGNATQRYFGKRVSVGCGHDHAGGAACSHLKQWWVGEVIGDFGAVPVTIALQRFAPNLMLGMQKLMEPVLGGFFKSGARRSARAQGFTPGSAEYNERVEAIYRHEVEHLPQAVIWTASSVALNVATQRLLGNRAPLWQLGAGKAVGASISAALVVGGRGLAPGTAERWDRFTGERIFLPATKAVGKLFGVDEQAVLRMDEKRKALREKNWADRVAQVPHETGAAPAR